MSVGIPVFNIKLLRVLSYFVCFLVILLKNFQFYMNPQFVAEDGTVLFIESYVEGLKSILNPLVGVFMPLPRLVMYFSLQLDLYLAPFVVLILLLIANAYILNYFSRETFRHVVKSDMLRIIFCITISLGSTSYMFTSLNHFCYPAILLLGYVLIEKSNSFRMFLLGLGSIFSTGFSAVFLPLFLYKIYLKDNRKTCFLLMLISLSVCLFSIYSSSNSVHKVVNFQFDTLYNAPFLFLKTFILSFFYARFFSNFSLISITYNFFIEITCIVLGGVVIQYVFRKIKFDTNSKKITLLLFSTFLTVAGQILFREYSFVEYFKYTRLPQVNSRYFFLTNIISLLWWLHFFEFNFLNLRRKYFFCSFILLVFYCNMITWRVNYDFKHNNWPIFVKKFEYLNANTNNDGVAYLDPPPQLAWADILKVEKHKGVTKYSIITKNNKTPFVLPY